MSMLNPNNCYCKEVIIIADNEDISGGVARRMIPFRHWTVYLEVNSPNNVNIEFSPEDEVDPATARFFGVPESPVRMLDSDSAEIEVNQEVGTIRVTGSTTALTTVIVRGVL